MSSRFNTLLLGTSDLVADELSATDEHPHATLDDLRLALINAHRRIDRLESIIAGAAGLVLRKP